MRTVSSLLAAAVLCLPFTALAQSASGENFGTTDTLYTMPEAGQGGGAGDPTPEQLAASPEAQTIIANAHRMAGDDADLMAAADQFCSWNAGANVARGAGPDFVQVFDDVYFANSGWVGAWVINTSDGIILWDTLNSEEEVKTIIEPGMRRFGLDPADIKVVVIGHYHNDHTGGLPYVQRTYNPAIYMGKQDWDVIMAGDSGLLRGEDVIDGQKLTLGDTSLTLLLLPGHTPGSVSGIFAGQYQGRTVNILNTTASRYSTYTSMAAFQRMFDEAKRAQVEAVVQVHPEINMLKIATLNALHDYPLAGPHPMLWSVEKTAAYMDISLECGRARVAANKTARDAERGPDYYRSPDIAE